MRRAVALLAVALMVLGAVGGIVCFVMMAGAVSPAERAADGAMLLIDAAVMTALSYLAWPRSAR